MAFTATEFEGIYKRCFPKAMGLAISLLYDEEEARDVVQQIFASLWESNIEIVNPDAFVYRSVRNMCLNRISSTSNRERIKRLYALELETLDDDVDRRIAEVQQAVKRLSERQQEVVREVFTEGNTYREAASNLNLSVSAINKHIVNALKQLRTQFRTNKI